MVIDVELVARLVTDIDVRTTAPDFAAGAMVDGDLDGIALWALLTGGRWPSLAAFTADAADTDTARAPRAAAVINRAGRVGVVLGFGFCAAPAGREYMIGPYEPQYWATAHQPRLVQYTGGGR